MGWVFIFFKSEYKNQVIKCNHIKLITLSFKILDTRKTIFFLSRYFLPFTSSSLSSSSPAAAFHQRWCGDGEPNMNSDSESEWSLLLLFFQLLFFCLPEKSKFQLPPSVFPSLLTFPLTHSSHLTSLLLIPCCDPALLWLSWARALVLLPQDVPDSGRVGSSAHRRPPLPHLWVPDLGGNQEWVVEGRFCWIGWVGRIYMDSSICLIVCLGERVEGGCLKFQFNQS